MRKIEAYEQGLYLMPVTPVTTQYWTTDDWLNFIDNHGRWLVEITE